MKTIAIIGAGAAGLMAAATILENAGHSTYHIHLFEKNLTPGKKVILSGGGRCNVTTSITDTKILSTKYTRGWEFIKKSMGKFSPAKCREWFETHGVPLKIQEDMRVFPVSDDGHDIVGIFQDIFAKYRDNITLHYGEGVTEIHNTDDSIIPALPLRSETEYSSTLGVTAGIHSSSIDPGANSVGQNQTMYQLTTPKSLYSADIVVITTGGNAYSHTGSTGDGYAFARALGHTVTRLGPSLSSFLTGDIWMHELSGVALEDARIGIPVYAGIPQKEIQNSGVHPEGQKLRGPILLTHFGLSGPLGFMLSSMLAWEDISAKSPRTISLAPIADMTYADWEAFFIREFALHPKKLITSILSEKITRRFSESIVKNYFAHIQDTFVGSIAKTERQSLAKILGDGIDITLIERRAGDEFVTAGGVETGELDPLTMQSKIQEHLYFAGEVLNVDGYTGGFSLQICWASGYVTGKNIVSTLS